MKKMILSLFVIFVALFTFTSNVYAEDLTGEINNEANIEERSINNFISYALKNYIENKNVKK